MWLQASLGIDLDLWKGFVPYGYGAMGSIAQ